MWRFAAALVPVPVPVPVPVLAVACVCRLVLAVAQWCAPLAGAVMVARAAVALYVWAPPESCL